MSDEQKLLDAAGQRLAKDNKAELEAALPPGFAMRTMFLICGGAGCV